MSRSQLRSGDVALLGRLIRAPLEIGNLPAENVSRLVALGLAQKVLGCCEITRAGQLTYYRQQFLKVSGPRTAVTRRRPFLHKMRFREAFRRARLSKSLEKRGRADAGTRAASRLPRWLARLTGRAEQHADGDARA